MSSHNERNNRRDTAADDTAKKAAPKKAAPKNKPEPQGETPPKRRGRLVWIIIQIFLIPLLLAGALGGGMVAGYVILGNGNLQEVLEWSTWQHVYDLVFAS